MEAVITAAGDIDDVNDSDSAALVDSFFIREELLWLANAISPRERGPVPGHVETVRMELHKMSGSLKAHQSLTFRLLDLRSDDANAMAGRHDRQPEPNPELGHHGVRRIIADVGYQQAIRELLNDPRLSDVTFAIPFLNDETEVTAVFDALGVTDPRRWGVFVETPASVAQLPRILDTGVSVINVGTKDLVQFMLAADRNNQSVASYYDTRHPSVMSALTTVAKTCADYDVVARVYALAADLDYYRSYLPDDTEFTMCAHELMQLRP
jgi:phosphoenolpyruvate-protein kinase (PTS system EI component)